MRETRVEGERVAGEGESMVGAQTTQRSTCARRRGRQSLEVVVSGHARDAVSPPPLCAPCRVELGGAAYSA
jgi:hypothetical protein